MIPEKLILGTDPDTETSIDDAQNCISGQQAYLQQLNTKVTYHVYFSISVPSKPEVVQVMEYDTVI